jgi:hypothetical protein
MRYTEPKIIRTDEAILAVQSLDKPTKPHDDIQDSVDNRVTTFAAYESDE